jgi:hypothetical protein
MYQFGWTLLTQRAIHSGPELKVRIGYRSVLNNNSPTSLSFSGLATYHRCPARLDAPSLRRCQRPGLRRRDRPWTEPYVIALGSNPHFH